MKIIKQGNYNPIKRFECDKCGCVFEAEKGEYQFLPFKENEYLCKCPTCENFVWEVKEHGYSTNMDKN